MKRHAGAGAIAMLAVSYLLLAGWFNGWHHSDDVPSGSGAVTTHGGINTNRLATLYEGRLLSPRDLYLLQRDGLAQAGVVTGPLACQGVTMQFDTETEADAYMSAHPELAKGQTACSGVSLHHAFRLG